LNTLYLEKLEKVTDIEENLNLTKLKIIFIGNADENKKEVL
jgi:hypothetical protein